MNPERGEFFSMLFARCSGFMEQRALPSKVRIVVRLDDAGAREHFVTQHRDENLFFGVATRREATP